MEKIQKQIIFLVFCFLLLVVSSLPAVAEAAVLYLSPAAGSHPVGSTFAVNVYASSTDQAINAVSGIVSFPQNNLQITSLSKSGSIIDTWVQAPVFSNSAGTADFQGITFNPGFTGASGQIIIINFKVISAGSALVNFSSGSVLANDGIGTEVLKSFGNAQFTLSTATPAPVPAPAPVVSHPVIPRIPSAQPSSGQSPSAIQISSLTHPDPTKWYNNNSPKFVWQLPSDILAIKTSFNKISVSQPTVLHEPAISEVDINSLKDGVYYFHAQAENSSGWGPVSNFLFQIDTQPPEPFAINLVNGNETDNPRPVIYFKTTDALSGFDYYKIKINNGDFFAIPAEQIVNDSYALPLQTPGQKQILVMALDKAGNYAVAYVEFTVKSITPPAITDYPQKIQDNTLLTIKGQSYPNSQIIIFVQGEGVSAEKLNTTSDANGNFVLTDNENLKNGVYTVWVQVVDNRGAISDDSDRKTIVVERSIILEVESWIENNIITAFLLVVLFCLVLTLFAMIMDNRKIAALRAPMKNRKI
jgi:hypothetical protein